MAGDEGDGRRNYRAEVVPWPWFLSKTADCRVFQKMTLPQIIEKIFQEYGFTKYKLQLKDGHPKWEYCVQYRETDFNFVSRLMEQEGIFYFFKHAADSHTMIIADHAGAYVDCEEQEVRFPKKTEGTEDHLTSWEHSYEFRSGQMTQTDYNFETPNTNLLTNSPTKIPLPDAKKYEIYDYPAEYETVNAGKVDTNARMEEEEAGYDIVHASSRCKSFTPGGKFKVQEHRSKSEVGKTYVITAIHHHGLEVGDYETGGSGGGEDYSNTFTAIPDKVVFRPARITPKPVIQGAQTAVVTGPKGEEIWPDKYGRVLVQFHWDREGKKHQDGKQTSCWMRCAQGSAGRGWGSMFIPRIGQEVLVTFLEGDPDQPLVTGVVYNADQMPPYTLPDEKTKSYIKTNSTLGGEGFNEIRIDDLKDKEQIFIHAQRNMDTRVRHDSMERVIANRHLVVGYEKDGKKSGDQREMVYHDKHTKVHGNQIEHVGGDMQLLIGGVDGGQGNQDIVIKANKKEQIGADDHLHVKGKRCEKVDGDQSLTIGQNQQEKVGMKHAVEAGQEIHLKAGMKVIIEAGMQISLVGPGGFVDIGPAGVTIQGIMVKINSGGSAGSGGGSSPTAPEDPKEAKPTEPTKADKAQTGKKSAPG
ncbi:MAG: type VI secretion system tip protein TssI/VgrG [Planctomycetota bacterium]|nr:type VI secretion system tip protein TssI/VgrG [Planctomycetota bacterium]